MSQNFVKRFIIYGAGGFAREIASELFFLALKNKGIHFDGFIDEKNPNRIMMGSEVKMSAFSFPRATHAILGTGTIDTRIYFFNEVKRRNLLLEPFFSENSKIGLLNLIDEGTTICSGSIITTGVQIKKGVLINLNCTIGHDSIIDEFSIISPGVNISGNVSIGKYCYIGSNSVIREKIKICDNVVLGAGSVVVKNIDVSGTYVGSPAKRIK